MSFLFNATKRDFANGVHDWDAVGQTFKVLLLAPGYTPDKDHQYVSDLVAHELSGPGYVGGFGGSGRKAIVNRTVVSDPVNDRAELDGDDASWPSLNAGAVAGAVIFRERTSDADSELIAIVDSGFPITSDGSDLSLVWNVEGILQIV
jgi:hypothetical protein